MGARIPQYPVLAPMTNYLPVELYLSYLQFPHGKNWPVGLPNC